MKKIRNEALILFSEKDYRDVFVGDIATAVGIKAPPLYKHFKGNQEIFDSCVEKFFERMTQIRNELFLPDTPQLDASYETADTEKITEFADVIPSVNGKPVEKIILENREVFISCFECVRGMLISDNGYQYVDGRPIFR